MSQLRVTSSNLNGGVFDLTGEYFTIGREPDNAIHLDHTSVSKHHAILKIDDGDLKLFDLHSTNGTIVNGELRVVSHLHEGDKILLGEVELRLESNNPATQRLTPKPPVPVAKPIPAPAVEAKAEPPKATTETIAEGAAAQVRKKPAGLLSLFRRSQSEEVLPSPPSSREEIRAGLSQKFDSMGLEMPNSPPTETPRPAEAFGAETIHLSVPPPKKPEPKPLVVLPPLPPAPAKATGPIKVIPTAPPKPEIDRLLRTPPPAALPEPPPPIVLDSRMARHRLTCFMSLIAGALLVGIGYLLDAAPLKFFGLLVAMGGTISLCFTLRFGNLVAPPRKKPPAS